MRPWSLWMLSSLNGCLRGMVWTVRRLGQWKEMVVDVLAEYGIDDFLGNLGEKVRF